MFYKQPRKTSEIFSGHQPGRYVNARKNVAYLGFFAKVSVQSLLLLELYVYVVYAQID